MRQQEIRLRYSRWGGRRQGAGRKPAARPRIRHLPRPAFARGVPCHVTLKVRPDVPSLRSRRLVRELETTFRRGCERGDFRLVHYTVQRDHLHLIVEAVGADALGRGMKAIGARVARAVNRVFGRRGPVLADRYRLRALRTPREVRAALRYVLLNARKHIRRAGRSLHRVDPASSGRWFDGWRVPLKTAADPPAVARPRGWLAGVEWRRHGLIDPADEPGPVRG